MATAGTYVLTMETLRKLLIRAGLQLGEQVVVRIKPSRLEITRNPAESLWGMLSSSKDAEQLRMEAYEELGVYLDAKT